MKSKLLSPEDVAERLAVNSATVRAWLRSGKLKGVKLGKKMWRIDEREVRELLCREESVEYVAGAAENDTAHNEKSIPFSLRARQAASSDRCTLSEDNIEGWKVTILDKGQILLPAELRRRYDLKQGDQLLLCEAEETIMLKPLPDHPLLKLRGSLKTKKGKSLTEELIDERIFEREQNR